jgi:hypothetical protein
MNTASRKNPPANSGRFAADASDATALNCGKETHTDYSGKNTMPIRLPASLALSLALITTACSAPMKNPDIKQNPHPAKRYEITITIDGAPGPFDSIDGYAMYQVKNGECVPVQPISGARPIPEKSIDLALTRTGNVYKGTFYVDQLQDEDYFGLGVCHWALTGAGALLHLRKIVFSPDISFADMQSQKTSVTYFANAAYHDLGGEGGDTGNPRTPYVIAHPSEFFSVTVVTKEDTQ